jgi:hypothetical protein
MNDIVHCIFCGCGGETVYQSANDAEGCICEQPWLDGRRAYQIGALLLSHITAVSRFGPKYCGSVQQGTEMPQQPASRCH